MGRERSSLEEEACSSSSSSISCSSSSRSLGRSRRSRSRSMIECMRKLALWDTRSFRPLITLDDLDPIMSTLGFIPVPRIILAPPGAIPWKEYSYSAAFHHSEDAVPPPRPRLPYPRIDGLHLYTYEAFLNAVNFYLKMANISDLFHIRGMPLHHLHDSSKKWSRIEEDDSAFVYWEGSVDQAVCDYRQVHQNGINSCDDELFTSIIRNGKHNAPIRAVVPLNDIIVNSWWQNCNRTEAQK